MRDKLTYHNPRTEQRRGAGSRAGIVAGRSAVLMAETQVVVLTLENLLTCCQTGGDASSKRFQEYSSRRGPGGAEDRSGELGERAQGNQTWLRVVQLRKAFLFDARMGRSRQGLFSVKMDIARTPGFSRAKTFAQKPRSKPNNQLGELVK